MHTYIHVVNKKDLVIHVRENEEDQKLGVKKWYLSPINRPKLPELLADVFNPWTR